MKKAILGWWNWLPVAGYDGKCNKVTSTEIPTLQATSPTEVSLPHTTWRKLGQNPSMTYGVNSRLQTCHGLVVPFTDLGTPSPK